MPSIPIHRRKSPISVRTTPNILPVRASIPSPTNKGTWRNMFTLSFCFPPSGTFRMSVYTSFIVRNTPIKMTIGRTLDTFYGRTARMILLRFYILLLSTSKPIFSAHEARTLSSLISCPSFGLIRFRRMVFTSNTRGTYGRAIDETVCPIIVIKCLLSM